MRRTILILSAVVAVIFILPCISPFGIPGAHGVSTTTNSGIATGATSYPSQRKTFYANGYWWIFYEANGNGIYYQSSSNGLTSWSAPTLFTNAGSTSAADTATAFSAWLSGTNLYYAVSPCYSTSSPCSTGGTQQFWFGEVSLGSGSLTYVAQDLTHSILSTHYGSSVPRVSVAVDGNGYLWVAMTTSSTSPSGSQSVFYIDVFECKSATITSCSPTGGATWLSYSTAALTTQSTNDLTTPALQPASLSSSPYVVLTYVNAASSGGSPGYGPFELLYGASGGSSITWTTVSPSAQAYHYVDYGTTGYTNGGTTTIYVSDIISGWLESFSYTLGASGTPVEITLDQSGYIASLSMIGSTLVAVWPSGASTYYQILTSGSTTWSSYSYLAQATEASTQGISVTYGANSNGVIGVLWENAPTPDYIRFATLTLTNFPVSVSLNLQEYLTENSPPPNHVYAVSQNNYFGISYTKCAASPCNQASMATDGSSGLQVSYAASSRTVTLATTRSPDVIILFVSVASTSSSIPTVKTVADGSSLSWSARKSISLGSASNGYYWSQAEWYAIASGTLSSDTITVTLTGSASEVWAEAFGVAGANTGSPFDGGAGMPVAGQSASAASLTLGVTTSNSYMDMLVAGFATWNAPATSFTWTSITSNAGYTDQKADIEYQLVGQAESNYPVALKQSSAAGIVGIIDAIQAASASLGSNVYNQYTSSTAAVLTIPYVESYTTVTISGSSFASSNTGEEWCLNYGCSNVPFGASDGIPAQVTSGSNTIYTYVSYWYFDQLAQPTKYAAYLPQVFSIWESPPTSPTSSMVSVNYGTAIQGTTDFQSLTTSTASIAEFVFGNAAPNTEYSSFTQWVRTRAVPPSGVMPTATFGSVVSAPFSAPPTVPTGVLAYVPITLRNGQSSPTPVTFQQMITVNSGSYQSYEAAGLQNVEFFKSNGTIIPSWLESGNANTGTATVYWLQLSGSISGSGGTLVVYMGFASTGTNLLSASGSTGEAPGLSSPYGQLDNGAKVFSFYDNFAGTTLSAKWQTFAASGVCSPTTTTYPCYAVNNGLWLLQTNGWFGVKSTAATFNPTTSVLDIDGYMPTPSSSNDIQAGYTTATAPPTSAGSLGYFVTTNGGNYQIYNCMNGATCADSAVIATDPTTPQTPSMTFVGAPSSAALTSTASPTTQYVNALGTYTQYYYILHNSTAYATQTFSGSSSSDQWGASPTNIAWTIFNANQINPNVVYYHQFLNTYELCSPGTGCPDAFTPGVTFILYGTSYGQAGTAITTFSSANPLQVEWTDAGASVSLPIEASNEPAGMRWRATANVGYVISSGGNIFQQTYYQQYSQSLSYRTADNSILPTGSVPKINFTYFGTFNVTALPQSTATVWMDSNKVAWVPITISGGTGERWRTPVGTWTITGTNVVTNPSIIYYHQFSQAVSYSNSDSQMPNPTPQLSYVANGTATAYTLTTSVHTIWIDAACQATVPNPILGVSGEQWTTAGSYSWIITGTNVVTNPIIYTHQYLVSFAVSPVGTGIISPSGVNVWMQANTAIQLSATPVSGFQFHGWTTTGSVTLGSQDPVTTFTLTGPTVTITANFQYPNGASFIESGLPQNTLWYVTMVGPNGYNNQISTTQATLTFSNLASGTYSWSLDTPISNGQTQYLGTPTGGQISVVSGSPIPPVYVGYQTQYYFQETSNPVGAATLQPGNGWYNSGAQFGISFSVVLGGATWQSWTGSGAGSYTGPNTIPQVTMNSPISETANFLVPLTITANPSTLIGGLGSTKLSTITVVGGWQTITVSASNVPTGVSVGFSPATFPASGVGATTTMTVSISTAAAYGTYALTVTGTDANMQAASTTVTLAILQPTVSTVGISTSSYAINYAGQSPVFYSQGLWWVFFSDGSQMIYRTSADGLSWSGSRTTNAFTNPTATGSNYGYSFAVTTYGNAVYFVRISPSDPNHFYWGSGTLINTNGVGSIHWSPLTFDAKQPLGITNRFTAGAPSITTDTTSCSSMPSAPCLWVTVPSVDNRLQWHILVFKYSGTWMLTQDISGGGGYSGSTLYSQVLTTTSGIVTIYGLTGNPSPINLLSADHSGLTWYYPVTQTATSYLLSQSQAISVGSTIHFAGVASDNTVKYWNYQWAAQITSTPATISGSVTNQVNHGWHASIAYGGTTLAIFFGTDRDVFFATSTNLGVTWGSPQMVSTNEAVVNGLSACYSGNSFGLVWLDKEASGLFTVRFATV